MKPFSDKFDAGTGSPGGHDNLGPYSKKILSGQEKRKVEAGEPKFSKRIDSGQKPVVE